MEAFNGQGHDRNLHMDGEDRRTFLEGFRRAVNRTLTFRIKNERKTVPESEGAGARGGPEISVWIEDNYFDGACQAAHESLAEDFAGAHGEQPAEHFHRQDAGQNERINIALMVRRNDVGPLLGQFLDPAYLQIKAVE